MLFPEEAADEGEDGGAGKHPARVPSQGVAGKGGTDEPATTRDPTASQPADAEGGGAAHGRAGDADAGSDSPRTAATDGPAPASADLAGTAADLQAPVDKAELQQLRERVRGAQWRVTGLPEPESKLGAVVVLAEGWAARRTPDGGVGFVHTQTGALLQQPAPPRRASSLLAAQVASSCTRPLAAASCFAPPCSACGSWRTPATR